MFVSIQMDVLEFAGYGANTIKTFKVSPDAFVQMALQLGVFKMTGIPQTRYLQCNQVTREKKTDCRDDFEAVIV